MLEFIGASILCAIFSARRAHVRGHDPLTFGWAGLWLGPAGYLLTWMLTGEPRPRLKRLPWLVRAGRTEGLPEAAEQEFPCLGPLLQQAAGRLPKVGPKLARWLEWRMDCWAGETAATRLLVAYLSLVACMPLALWPLLRTLQLLLEGMSLKIPWCTALTLKILTFPQLGWLAGLSLTGLAALAQRFVTTPDEAHLLYALELTTACGYPWDQALLCAGCLLPPSTLRRLKTAQPTGLEPTDRLRRLADGARADCLRLARSWFIPLRLLAYLAWLVASCLTVCSLIAPFYTLCGCLG